MTGRIVPPGDDACVLGKNAFGSERLHGQRYKDTRRPNGPDQTEPGWTRGRWEDAHHEMSVNPIELEGLPE
jgi:hypothetical protein